MKSLIQIQSEIGDWARRQFGDNPNRSEGHPGVGTPLGSQPALNGMNEEVGELAGAALGRHDAHVAALASAMMKINHAYVYRQQGRGDYADVDKYLADLEDGLADLMVFACDFCNRVGRETGREVNLLGALNETWDRVCKRRRETWNADKSAESSPAPAVRTGPKVEVIDERDRQESTL